jgi:hypothetical protein
VTNLKKVVIFTIFMISSSVAVIFVCFLLKPHYHLSLSNSLLFTAAEDRKYANVFVVSALILRQYSVFTQLEIQK